MNVFANNQYKSAAAVESNLHTLDEAGKTGGMKLQDAMAQIQIRLLMPIS